MDQRSEEVDALRQKLVNAYTGKAFDAEEAGQATSRLRELVSQMNVIDKEKIDLLRSYYEASYGVREAARRAFVSRGTALSYYHSFRLEARTVSKPLQLGDPPPDRSALKTFKPWKPIYDDKPRKVHEEIKHEVKVTEPITLAKPKVDQWGNASPTADHVALAIVLASGVTGADPIVVAAGEQIYTTKDYKVPRARAYAGFALCEAFPGISAPTIAKLVGVTNGNSRQAYFSSLNHRQKMGTLTWYNPEVTKSIVAQLGGSH